MCYPVRSSSHFDKIPFFSLRNKLCPADSLTLFRADERNYILGPDELDFQPFRKASFFHHTHKLNRFLSLPICEAPFNSHEKSAETYEGVFTPCTGR